MLQSSSQIYSNSLHGSSRQHRIENWYIPQRWNSICDCSIIGETSMTMKVVHFVSLTCKERIFDMSETSIVIDLEIAFEQERRLNA